MKRLLALLTLLILFSSTNVYASGYSSNYELYLNLTPEEKANSGYVPEKNTIPFDNIEITNEKGTIKKKITSYALDNYGGVSDYNLNDEILGTIPASYDIRDETDIEVYNQGSYNTCYAFATLSVLELTMQKNHHYYYDFSAMHAEYMTLRENGGTRNTFDSGGNFTNMAIYLLKGDGPVLTEDVPYRTYTSSEVNSWSSLSVLKNVLNVLRYPTIDKYNNVYSSSAMTTYRESLKRHIMEEGPVFSSIYAGETGGATVYQSLNSSDYVLNYKGGTNTKPSNHAITIIGWDDNYSKANFPETIRPKNDGAYLILNSWGSSMPYIWVSYEDIWIEYDVAGFAFDDIGDNVSYNTYNKAINTNMESYYYSGYNNTDFSNVYFDTSLPSNDSIKTLYFGNKYSRSNINDEKIKEIIVPFMINVSDVHTAGNAEVFVNPIDDTFDESKLISVGTIDDVTTDGFVKLVLDDPITLTGSAFSVVVEMNSVYTYSNTVNGVNSYISDELGGTYYELDDLYDRAVNNTIHTALFPLIVRTDEVNEHYISSIDLRHINEMTTNTNDIIRFHIMSDDYDPLNQEVNVKILKNNVDVTSNFDINGTKMYYGEAVIRVRAHQNIPLGFYKMEITYLDSDPLLKEFKIVSEDIETYPNLFSMAYSINKSYIKGVTTNTSIASYLSNFTIGDEYKPYLNVYDSTNELITEGNMATGYKTMYTNSSGNIQEVFTNVVSGDDTGDGQINIADLYKLSNYINSLYEDMANEDNPDYVSRVIMKSDFEKLAIDTNHDGTINIADLYKLSNYINQQYAIAAGEEVTNPITL